MHTHTHTYKEKHTHTLGHRGTARSLLVSYTRPVFTAWHRNREESETNRRRKVKKEPKNVKKKMRERIKSIRHTPGGADF